MQVKINPNAALAELCKRSFYRFVQEFWEVVIPEPPVWNWHIKYLCDELQYLNSFVVARKPKPYDLAINIPPGSTKSTIATQMYNAWVWAIDPKQRFITSSYAHSLSLSHAIKTRDIVTSDKYKALFPGVELKQDQSGKSDFRNVKGGQRFTTSTGGTVTGMHAHQIIVDDPINPQQSASDVERESANNFVTSTLSSRKIDKAITPMILIMQRLHESDPTGVMLSKKSKKIKHINLPAEDKGNVKPKELSAMYVDGLLDPVRLSRDILAEALVDLGSYGYAGQYTQNPAPEDGGLIKKDWFPIIDWEPSHTNLTWNFVADTAYTADEANDPSGYIAYAKDGNDFIVRNAVTEHLEFPDLCKALPSFAHQNGYSNRSIIEIEPKASGKSLAQTLKRETKLNVKEGKPPAKDKTARVKDSSPTLESGRVKLIRGHWNKPFLDQLTTFPNADHDEFVDCITMMVGDTRQKKKGLKRRN
jgi:predicted phage terminase large subunit-like protein